MHVHNDQLKKLIEKERGIIKAIAAELLAYRMEKSALGIYDEIRPRFYPRFDVVYIDEKKVCGYIVHTGRFSAISRAVFDKNFRKSNG